MNNTPLGRTLNKLDRLGIGNGDPIATNTVLGIEHLFPAAMLGKESLKAGHENLTNEATETTSPQHEWVNYHTAMPSYPTCPPFPSPNENGGTHYDIYIIGLVNYIGEYSSLVALLGDMTDVDTMTIYLDSPGGSLYTGAAIASLIEKCKGKVTAYACGQCASAASLIWSAAHVQKISRFATLMYHMSSHFDYGSSDRIRDNADIAVKYVVQKCLKRAAEKGHLTEEEVNLIANKYGEVWIGYSEMANRLGMNVMEGTEHFAPVYIDGDDEKSPFAMGSEGLVPQIDFTIEDLNKMEFTDARKAIEADLCRNDSDQADKIYDFTIIRNGVNKYTTLLDGGKRYWHHKFLLSFARTLDKLTEADTLTIVLPGGINSYAIPYIGMILSVIERCKANVITQITSMASFGDIAIWMFGKERETLAYGQRTFGAELISDEALMRNRGEYIRIIIDRAVEIGLITLEQAEEFLNDRQNIILDLNSAQV